jgi:Alanine-zipper, major outer membrane lipoprotein
MQPRRFDLFGNAGSRFAAGELPIESTSTRRNLMSKTRTVAVGLSMAAALLMLSACTSPDELSNLDDRVGALESRVDSMDARATQAEAAANQCTATCQEAEARANRMFQQSMTK